MMSQDSVFLSSIKTGAIKHKTPDPCKKMKGSLSCISRNRPSLLSGHKENTMSEKPQNMKAQISRILKSSCVDGPGNRFVLFLQGCNFKCINCHNPHTIQHCRDCAECIPHCPTQALQLNTHKKVVWNEAQCTGCDKCIDVCPYQSNPKILLLSVFEVLEKIKQCHLFLNGITLSGGESTLQLPFIVALFKAIKTDPALSHLTCFIDSNGSLSHTGWQRVMPYLDGAMIDLKAWQSETHLWLVGQDKHRVISSINFLAKEGKLHEVRLLPISEKSDLGSNVHQVGEYLKNLPTKVKIRLNAFGHHGVVGEALTWEKCTESDLLTFHDALYKILQRPILLPSVYP